MFLLYNLVLTFLSPIWVPWMLWRSGRRAEKVDWKQRQGSYAIKLDKDRPRVWLHAVSVGEVIAALPIIQSLKQRAPEVQLILSVTTSSGHQTARERALEWVDHVVYFPIDVVRFQLGAMVWARPNAVAVMETELWMNFLWAAKAVDASTLLVNGRVNPKSFGRKRLLRLFYRSLFKFLDQALMQTEEDAARIRSLGATEARVLGNAKFDQAGAESTEDGAVWRKELGLGDAPVVVVGSTRGEDEESFVLEALAPLMRRGLKVVHAPRHLERVPALAERVQAELGTVALRSQNGQSSYVVLDTYGELAKVYAAADVVIVGGGFGEYGGQNLIQPLAHGKPVIHGPHMHNFADAARVADERGAARMVTSPDALRSVCEHLLFSSGGAAERAEMAAAARQFIRENEGAADRYATAILAAAGIPDPAWS